MLYGEVSNLLDTLRKAADFVKGCEFDELISKNEVVLYDITDGVRCVNKVLFDSAVIVICNLDSALSDAIQEKNITIFLKEFDKWNAVIDEVVTNRINQPNNIDEQFAWLIDHVTYVDSKVICGLIKERLLRYNENELREINYFFQDHARMFGTLDTYNGIYEVVFDRVNSLIEHKDDFIWLYHKLGDYRSKQVLVNTLYNWLTFDQKYLESMCENNYKDYYDLDLLQCDQDEVIVDLGAYIGDSALDFISTFRRYKKIYCYDITPRHIEIMQHSLKEYDGIEVRYKGVGAKQGKLFRNLGRDAGNYLTEQNYGNEIDVVTIDDDILEKVTLIKMDIEGGEQDALKGCKRHITEERPKLLICVYHNNRDIVEVPKMIMEMRDDYKLYLRSNGKHKWVPQELVLFAV